MKPLVNPENRRYRSRLREEQAAATRDRIMEAVVRILAQGVAGLSMPAVAREAGVSIPTVYRNFPTKRHLLEAVYPWSVRRTSGPQGIPRTVLADDFRSGLRLIFERFDALGDLERAAIASRGAEAVRALTMDRRLEMARAAAEAVAPGLPAEDREHIARLIVLLTTTATVRMLREHLGLSLDAAVDEVDWAVRAAVVGALTSRDGTS